MVIEKILKISVYLASWTSLKKVREWILVDISKEGLFKGRCIDSPNIYAVIISSWGEEKFSIIGATYASYLTGVRYESHCLVWIPFQW